MVKALLNKMLFCCGFNQVEPKRRSLQELDLGSEFSDESNVKKDKKKNREKGSSKSKEEKNKNDINISRIDKKININDKNSRSDKDDINKHDKNSKNKEKTNININDKNNKSDKDSKSDKDNVDDKDNVNLNNDKPKKSIKIKDIRKLKNKKSKKKDKDKLDSNEETSNKVDKDTNESTSKENKGIYLNNTLKRSNPFVSSNVFRLNAAKKSIKIKKDKQELLENEIISKYDEPEKSGKKQNEKPIEKYLLDRTGVSESEMTENGTDISCSIDFYDKKEFSKILLKTIKKYLKNKEMKKPV